MADRRQLDVVRVQGPDAEQYLQGQLSQNVVSMAVGDVSFSLLLQPQGHMVGWFRIVRTAADAFAFLVEAGGADPVVARLERFKLGTKAEISASTESVVSVRASGESDDFGPSVVAGELAAVALGWPGLNGVDLFGKAKLKAADMPDSGLVEALRIGAGIPTGADYGEKTIPAELGIVDLSADFAKGCYTGQELVARIDSRGGNTPRQLRVLCGIGEAPNVGDDVNAEGDLVGALTSVVSVSDGWLGLASIKRAALEAAEVTVGGATASVHVSR